MAETYKTVHVNSRIPIRGIKEPFIGIRRNVKMSLTDIGVCLSKGAAVTEVRPDGTMVKLTVKNYRDENSEPTTVATPTATETPKIDSTIVSSNTTKTGETATTTEQTTSVTDEAEAVAVAEPAVVNEEPTTEDAVESTDSADEVENTPVKESTEEVATDETTKVETTDTEVTDAATEDAPADKEVSDEATEDTTDEGVAEEKASDVPNVTYDTIEDFTKAGLIAFATANGIDVDGMTKSKIIEVLKEYLSEKQETK